MYNNMKEYIIAPLCLVILLCSLSPALSQADSARSPLVRDRPECRQYEGQTGGQTNMTSIAVNKSIELWQALVLFSSFAVFSLVIAGIYRVIRTYVYYDSHILDTFFDGGSEVTMGLIMCSVVAKWAWSASFTWSTISTQKYGIVGHFWYAAGTAIQLFLFAIVIVEIRIKSPGAKTYLQVIQSRFGSGPHVLLISFALFTNLVVTGMVMSEGTTILSSLTSGIGKEVICVILAAMVGVITLVSGVGGSMYISYFSCVFLVSVVLFYLTDIYYDPWQRPYNPLGSTDLVFNITQCGRAHLNNERFSLFTFVSRYGVLEGAIVTLSSLSCVFVNQSFWQTGITGKPGASVMGYLTAGLVWFTIPLGGAFALGLAYWALSLQQGQYLLNEEDSLHGLVPVVTSQRLLGKVGDWLMFTFTMVAIVTTLCGEVLSVSSIVIYDIYQTYIAPFISLNLPTDQEVSARTKRQIRNEEYLEYDKRCCFLKNVVVICVSVLTIPTTLAVLATGIDLQWLYYALGILVGPCVLPIALSVIWHRITSRGVVFGVLLALVAAMVAWLVYASTLEGGLREFHRNTGDPRAVVTGLVTAVVGGGVICLVVSLATGGCSSELMEDEEWERTRKVDNPILPWSVKYAPDIGAHQMSKGKPHFFTVRRTFKGAETCAYILGVLMSVVLVLVWPAAMLLLGVFDLENFKAWTVAVLTLCCVAVTYVVVVPLVGEVWAAGRQAYFNRKWRNIGGRPSRLQDEASEHSTKVTESTGVPMPAPRVRPTARDREAFDTIPEAQDSYQGKDSSSVGSNDKDKDRWKTFIHIDQ